MKAFLILCSVWALMGSPQEAKAQGYFQDQITNLYHTVLGREPDPDGLNYWTQNLMMGVPLHDIRYGFAHSTEAVNLIDSIYVEHLGRHAEPEGSAYWQDVLMSHDLGLVRNAIANSAEAQARRAPPPPPPPTSIPPEFIQSVPQERELLNCWGKPVRIYGPC